MISRILFVDGSRVIINALSTELSEEFNVLKAYSFQEAQEILKKEEVDALVTARTLPDGSGFDLAAEVKKKKDIPVIMLIADEDVTVFELHPYVDVFISKVGLTAKKIISELENFEKEINEIKNREEKLILVVDDSTMLRKAIVNKLSKKYNVEEAENGREAFEKAIKLVPDLITMDVDMPVMDGITSSSFIRAHVRTRNVPILLLTSHKDPETVKKAFEAGVNMHLPKDTPVEELVAAVENILSRKPKQEKILFVTTEDHIMEALVATPVRTEGYVLNIATSIEEAEDVMNEYNVVIINDEVIKGRIPQFLKDNNKKVIILTDDPEKFDGFEIVEKPFEAEDLIKLISKMLAVAE